MPRGKLTSALAFLAIALGALILVGIGTSAFLFFRYVKTTDADAPTAAREFVAARARFQGQSPFIEYQGLKTPIVRRDPSAPRQQIVALHAMIFSATDGFIRRADVPFWAVQVMTVGGRLSLMNLGLFGDDRDLITLEDLERHGPGLLLDTNGGAVGALIVGDALLHTDSKSSQMLVWTE